MNLLQEQIQPTDDVPSGNDNSAPAAREGGEEDVFDYQEIPKEIRDEIQQIASEIKDIWGKQKKAAAKVVVEIGHRLLLAKKVRRGTWGRWLEGRAVQRSPLSPRCNSFQGVDAEGDGTIPPGEKV